MMSINIYLLKSQWRKPKVKAQMDAENNLTEVAETKNIVKTHTLPQEESQHAVKVLRMTAGDRISLVDGQGNAYDAAITNPHQKRCEVEILSVESNVGAHPYRLHIAIAPTKLNERMEWFLEKCTEIGIDEITPILTAHSERKELKNERMEKMSAIE